MRIRLRDLVFRDAHDRRKGRQRKITVADVLQSNGVIHAINAVLMPKI
ncbi:MAG: hypothetical protein J0H60_09090 [Rhizobiales bacterium]|jgi:hypothetical protein|nr:hypothetical protein [Hyphomicrobiales bacterium]